MSITFMVSGWHEQTSHEIKVYAKDEYPELDDFYFESDPSYKKDNNGFYCMKTIYSNAFPDMNVSGFSGQLLIESMGYIYCECGEFPIEQLPEVVKNCIKLINSDKKLSQNVREPEIDRNIFSGGASKEYIIRKINELLSIIKFAQSENKSVYWA